MLRCTPGDGSIDNSYRQLANPANEIRAQTLRWPHDLEPEIPLQDFLSENADLLLGEPVANTTVDAGTEGEMLTGFGAIDDKFIGAVDLFFVAIN